MHSCRFPLLLATILALILVVYPAAPGWGQVDRSEFDRAMAEWKKTYIELLEAYTEFITCEEWEADEIRERFLALKQRGDDQQRQAIEQAARVYQNSDQNIEELNRLLRGLPLKLFERYQYDTAARVGKALLRHDPNNRAVLFDAIKSSFFSNQFDLTEQLLDVWREQFGTIPAQLEPIESVLADYQQAWKAEQQKQQNRDAAEPLPQVRFSTPRGDFVVELFEDEYPVIVNNLINLIEERQLYQGFRFFEVLEHQVARSGCPRNDGQTMLPVASVDPETLKSGSRHFRGTFSLLVNPGNGAASTQFVVSRIPMPELDGRNLVVGRVVEGQDVVDRLAATTELDENLMPQLIEDAEPDPIETIQVLQKRDREYNFIEGQ